MVKKVNLLLASYIFYAAWNPPFILLLWLSTVVDYFVGRALYTQDNLYKRKLLLVLSLTAAFALPELLLIAFARVQSHADPRDGSSDAC
jgi:alginate O-acetyltransferase complex protein AlgI